MRQRGWNSSSRGAAGGFLYRPVGHNRPEEGHAENRRVDEARRQARTDAALRFHAALALQC
jgi:hypothetical protein